MAFRQLGRLPASRPEADCTVTGPVQTGSERSQLARDYQARGRMIHAALRCPGLANHRVPVTTNHMPAGKPEWSSDRTVKENEMTLDNMPIVRRECNIAENKDLEG